MTGEKSPPKTTAQFELMAHFNQRIVCKKRMYFFLLNWNEMNSSNDGDAMVTLSLRSDSIPICNQKDDK